MLAPALVERRVRQRKTVRDGERRRETEREATDAVLCEQRQSQRRRRSKKVISEKRRGTGEDQEDREERPEQGRDGQAG